MGPGFLQKKVPYTHPLKYLKFVGHTTLKVLGVGPVICSATCCGYFPDLKEYVL